MSFINTKLTTALAGAFILSLASIGGANALNFRLGEVEIQIDNVASVGASIRVEDRDSTLLPARNGGPKDLTIGVNAADGGAAQGALVAAQAALAAVDRTDEAALMAAQTALATAQASPNICGTASNPVGTIGAACMFNQSFLATVGSSELYNYDASINTDDGRLNFDSGDFTGGVFKLTTELEASYENVTLFARTSAFYDAVLSDDSQFARTGLNSTAARSVGGDIDLLDFYVDIDLNPVFIRAGRQVINWGEATFFLGGNSVFNPIDVPAFRRPGSEIKEALLPVEAIYAAVSLPYDLTLEAYYGSWDQYSIDVGGTPYANSDGFRAGSKGNYVIEPDMVDADGNVIPGGGTYVSYVGSGATSGSAQINCSLNLAMNNPNSAETIAIGNAINGAFNNVAEACAGTSNILNYNAAGNVEGSRQAQLLTYTTANGGTGNWRDSDYLARAADDEPGEFDTANYGLALRWYAEALNSTEFGLYYQKYTSRIPYAGSVAYQPFAGVNVTGPDASSTLRGATMQGCGLLYAATLAAAGAAPTTFARSAALESIQTLDPSGVGDAQREFYEQQVALGAASTFFAQAATAATAGIPSAIANTPLAAVTPLVGTITSADILALAREGLALEDGSVAEGQALGCIGQYAQSLGGTGALAPTGATSVVTRYRTGIIAEYPEDIEVWGASFNTTLLGWGIQGEVAYRPNMPLQLDTDAVAIAALSASCAWENFNFVANTYYDLQTIKSECGQFNTPFHGFVREQVYNFDIGTTATFTRSNPVVSVLGADLAVFLTELGVVYVPDAHHYDHQRAPTDGTAPHTHAPYLANVCTSGSNLPLGGVFGLDPRSAEDCRPDDLSAGIVLFGYLQYNNVLGTAIGLRPQVAVNVGVYGNTPSPAGSFREEQVSANFSLGATYQAEWSASIGYTLYEGDELYNRNIDRDQFSANISYAF